METNNNDTKYFKAKQRVAALKKFYNSLIIYIVFIAALGGLNYYQNEWRYAWFLWAAFGWGIGIFFHALKVFNFTPFLGKNWEERKMKEFMQDEERKNQQRNL